MGPVPDAMGLARESGLRVDNLRLGHWEVRVSGPETHVRSLTRVLHSLALPNDDLPPLMLTITPDGRYATGAVQGSLQWSVALPQQGWLSVLAGQVVATATALLRCYLFIHAGAVALDGGGWVIVGESGAGKTSTVAALMRRGGAYLSDEVALFDPMTRSLHPFALPMAVKPWTKKAAGNLPAGREVAREGTVRFLLPARLEIASVPVEAFVLLKPARVPARWTSISRADMLLNIAKQTSSFSYQHRCEDAFSGFGRFLHTARCYVLESSSPATTLDRLQGPLFKPSVIDR